MGRKCSVENCTSDSTKPEHTGVTFHKVPPHSDVRGKWLSLCRIPVDKSNAKLLFVCSRHFLRADFCNFKGKKYMLRQGVLPSVFPWDKSRLEAIKAEVSVKKDAEPSKKKEKGKSAKKKENKMNEVASTSKIEALEKDSAESDVKIEPEDIKPDPDDLPPVLEPMVPIPEPQIKEEPETPIKEEAIDKTDAFDQHQRSQETPVSSNPPINFTINSRIEVLDNNNVWYPAKINEVDYEENEVLIHFEKFSSKFDEWISMTSPRLRPLQPKFLESYEVGERCMAMWSDFRKFPATVTKKLENDTYEVLFDDNFVKAVKGHKMSKMNVATSTKSSPLFDPVKGTKQDRRDKKRKLNVAALFHKKTRRSGGAGGGSLEEKKNKACGSPAAAVPSGDEASLSPAPLEEASMPSLSVAVPPVVTEWRTTWENGKPVGIDSTIETADGLRKSVVVPDPRLPVGWAKHISQRISGNLAGKWETIIVAPDGKRFRSKSEVKTYLELHRGVEVTIDMFDFSIYRGLHSRKKSTKSKQKAAAVHHQVVQQQQVEQLAEETTVEESLPKEEASPPEEPPVSLKIIHENDAYKCPIAGCGKNFRRENLALMHVKHYHSEYTKYLDSTPNVADLAYARTVGESLDRSPGPPKASATKTASTVVDKTPVTPKLSKSALHNIEAAKTEESPLLDSKNKDSEIIKLLSQKPPEISKEIQPLPSGLPTSMYPDIKLKDLLGTKSDELHMRDDINIKNLCSSRPSQGIKTLLPVVRPATGGGPSNEPGEDKTGSKRKRPSLENVGDVPKGKLPHHHQAAAPPSSLPDHHHQQPPHDNHHQQPAPPKIHHHHVTSDAPEPPPSPPPPPHVVDSVSAVANPTPTAFDLAPPPAGLEATQTAPTVAQFDGVIIEGGKIIKLERMKQEEIINCTCGFPEEDGLMIQCELCLCWQHAYCNNIQKESEVPEKYTCYICLHPLRERISARYLHDQEWLKQGVLPMASYNSKDKEAEQRFEKLKKCHDLSGGILELREYMHTLAVKLKIAEAKDHPKLYLWSKPWEKPKLPEKAEVKQESADDAADVKPKLENDLHHHHHHHHHHHRYVKNDLDMNAKHHHGEPQGGGAAGDSMLMMILKSGKEDIPMLNMHSGNMAPIIPRPEAAIDSDDCRLNLLDHIAHSESLVEERLDDFEKQLEALEEGMSLEADEDYPKTRQTLQLLMKDLDTLSRFSELPMT